MKIISVPISEIPEFWNKVSSFINDALAYGHEEANMQDVYKDVLKGKKQLWIITTDFYKLQGAFITEIADYPRKRVIRIMFLGGAKVDEWKKDVTDTMIAWGKVVKAKAIEVIGRKGWERSLKDLGYLPAYVHLLKEI